MNLKPTLLVTSYLVLFWAIWALPLWRFLLAAGAICMIGVLVLLAIDTILREREEV